MDVKALYNDGHVARSSPVVVRIEGETLAILDAKGTALDRWQLAEVRLVGRPEDGQPTRLASGFEDDARITIVDSADLPHLELHCPNLRRTQPGFSAYWRPVALWGGGAVVSVVLLVTVFIPMMAEKLALAMPPAWEQALGERTRDGLLKILATMEGKDSVDDAICRNPEAERLLADLATRLTRGQDDPIPVTITVIDTTRVNAFALPGGQILILRGLLDLAEDGDELAAVLGHEIAHVALRHPTVLTLRESATAALIGLLLGDVTGGTALAGLGQVLLSTAYTREAETAADALGAEMIAQAGLDTGAPARILRRLKDAQGDLPEILAFLSTHPPLEKRAHAVAAPTPGRAVVTAADWKQIQGMCE